MKRGLFITFEGGEGSGKTTQIKKVAAWLQGKKRKVVITREPGGTPFADKIRKILLNPKNKKIDPILELLLYEAARKDHVEKVIRPALNRGSIVLCDRFTDATTVYQGYGRGLSLAAIQQLNQAATGGLQPDKTFLLSPPPKIGLSRTRSREKGKEDRFENEPPLFHKKVHRGYLTLAAKEKRRFVVVNTHQPKEKTFQMIVKKLEKMI